MGILKTIKNLIVPERETLWLLFSFWSDPDILSMYFKTIGSHASVMGNKEHYDIVMDAVDNFRGFLHTHPYGYDLAPSYYDVVTVGAWEKAIGRPLLNIIATPDLRNSFTLFGGNPYHRNVNIHPSGRVVIISDGDFKWTQ